MYISAAILAVCLAGVVNSSSLRFRRQYGTDDYDPVTGVQIGECTFYGDYTTDCTGRLTCRPQDLGDRSTLTTMDRVCPKNTGTKSGRWDRDQVIPSNMIPRDAGSGRIGKCQFYANRQSGNFKCTGVQGDTWKGEYTGALNTAFKLGLSQTAYGPGTAGTASSNNNDRYGGRQTGDDGYGTSSNRDRDYTGRDDYNSRLPSSLGATVTDRDRDRNYGSNYRDNDAINTNTDRYQTTYGSSGRDRDRESSYPRTTSTEVIMCTYTKEGKGSCRDCTERVDRKETTTEIRTNKHYTCTGPETKVNWSEDNGIMPRGTRPDRYGLAKDLVATCIFDKTAKTFNCHGSSTSGNCATDYASNSRYGSDTTQQRCLGGEKWSGTYRGSVYNI